VGLEGDDVEYSSADVDVVLIGGGIMSATLGVLLRQVRPDWSITTFERLEQVGLESSNGWNNAGTGHAGLCELNYTPERADGSIDLAKAIRTNEQYQESLELWASLVERELLPEPATFVNPVAHMSYVAGDADVSFLRRRYESLAGRPLFEGMQYTESTETATEWAPLMMRGRESGSPIAMTRIDAGTDVDYGTLTRHLFAGLGQQGGDLVTNTEVEGLDRQPDGRWKVTARNRATSERTATRARFVFIGAGGYAIHLLQKSGIPEAKGYGGFPVSGQFLRCTNPDVIALHDGKVYGKSQAKAPPMAMPHLDRRYHDGEPGLLFGPYAGFSPKYLKQGSWTDLFRSIKPDNILTMLTVAKDEWDLTRYLIGQVLQKHISRMNVLRDFVPTAEDGDWELIHAGQRVQTMKRTASKRGAIVFGTEVVAAHDGSIAGLMGASPGASTATAIMLDVMRACFPSDFPAWEPKLRELIPSVGVSLSDDPVLREDIRSHVDRVLRLHHAPAPQPVG
jgi:malate dehydrogenase (quinone)